MYYCGVWRLVIVLCYCVLSGFRVVVRWCSFLQVGATGCPSFMIVLIWTHAQSRLVLDPILAASLWRRHKTRVVARVTQACNIFLGDLGPTICSLSKVAGLFKDEPVKCSATYDSATNETWCRGSIMVDGHPYLWRWATRSGTNDRSSSSIHLPMRCLADSQ